MTTQANGPAGAPNIDPLIPIDLPLLIELVQILTETYVCLMVAILAFLVLSGPFRRCCHNWLFKIMVREIYLLSTLFVAIITLLMILTSTLNELFVLWALFLQIVGASADSFSTYSLKDIEHWKRDAWFRGAKLVALGSSIPYSVSTSKLKYSLCFLYIATILKTVERVCAFKLASRAGLVRKTKLITYFMGYEHELSNHDEVDPTHMKGYKYLVRGEAEKMVTLTPPLYQKRLEMRAEVITIDKIWQVPGRLLTSMGDPDNKLKDICLSFALYKLICRRFAEYPLLECPHGKTWNFVRYGLLSKEDDYERAFRVIEVELAFLFDLFYTKYHAILKQGRLKLKTIELIFVTVGCLVSASILPHYHTTQGKVYLIGYRNRLNIDILVSGIVIMAILCLEVVQIIFIIFSDWAKVISLCKYVQKPSWQASRTIEMMTEFVCRRQLLKPWARELGQYSLLRSFNYNPSRLLYNFLTSAVLDSPGKGRKESTRTKLPAEVKKAIILSLKINGPRLTNGEASLRQNGVENELSWACRLETNTHVIMVWHMATSLCEVALAISDSSSLRENFIVATSLSKYCAYLVAFAPRFLPDNPHVSEFIFDQMVIETRDFLKKCESMEKRLEKMMTLDDGDCGDTVIQRSALLGKRLIQGIEDEELRWKILADFWAEMMLFVAPSDHPTIHAESLAEGGQFVTHLWALLSHAGILKQDYVPKI